jgi:hypothetical protein
MEVFGCGATQYKTNKLHGLRGATRFRPIPYFVQSVYKCVNLALFADDTCLYATDRKEGYVLRKIQRGLNCMAE